MIGLAADLPNLRGKTQSQQVPSLALSLKTPLHLLSSAVLTGKNQDHNN